MVILAGFLAVVAWVFFDRGLGASAYDAFQRPHLLLLVFVVTVLSGGFHEFGHAAAARYSGAQPGVMGAGLYLVWPAFYTDVTDSYRLGRAGRIRTDLGGLYFNAIVVVATFVWWWATGWEALLLLVAIQVLQMVKQLLPLLRFDGYHLLADLAGVPDLYHRIKPILLGLLPHRWKSPENTALKPWARALITAWVLVTVPMMALMFWAMLQAVPRLLGSAGSVLGRGHRRPGRRVERRLARRHRGARRAGARGGAARAGLRPDLRPDGHQVRPRTAHLVRRVHPQAGRSAGRHRRRRGRHCAGSGGRRRHLQADPAGRTAPLHHPRADPADGPIRQRHPASGTGSLTPPPPRVRYAGTAAQSRLSSGRPLVAAFEKGRALPTKEDPVLAMVLVPRDEAAHPTAPPSRAARRPAAPSDRAPRRTTCGSSPSTSRSRPPRATTRPSPSPPRTARSATTSRSRSSGSRTTRSSTSTRPTPTPRARTASLSPSPSRSCSSWTTPGSSSRRTSPPPPTTTATSASPPPSPASSCSRSRRNPDRSSSTPWVRCGAV